MANGPRFSGERSDPLKTVVSHFTEVKLSEERKKYRCNKADECGVADECFHGKPHEPIRCGNCSTWCDQSIFCQPGTACLGRKGRLNEENGKMNKPVRELLPMKCVEIVCG
jgi:hypothetical protein